MKIPEDRAAEEAVLGSVFFDSSVMANVRIRLTRQDFYQFLTGMVFDAMCRLHDAGKPIDIVTVSGEVDAKAWADHSPVMDAASYILALAGSMPTAANCDFYIDAVLKASKLRRIAIGAGEIYTYAANPGADVSRAESMLDGLVGTVGASNLGDGAVVSMRDAIVSTIEQLQKPASKIMSGIHILDKKLGGLRPGELTVIAARPGKGKTVMGAQYARRAAEIGIRVLLFTAEMPKEQITQRLMFGMAKVNLARSREYGYTDQDTQALSLASQRLAKLPILLVDIKSMGGDMTPDRISSVARAEVRRSGVGLVVVDYLQKLSVGDDQKRFSRDVQVGYASSAMQRLSVNAGVPVLAMAQIRRAHPEFEDREPTMDDLRESGNIEQDAANIVLIHHVKETTAPPPGSLPRPQQVKLIIAKQRDGESDIFVSAMFDKEHGSFIGVSG